MDLGGKLVAANFSSFRLFRFFLFLTTLFLPFPLYSERPAAIPVEVKSIDDTSNFDDFPDVELKIRESSLFDVFCSTFDFLFSLVSLASASAKESESAGSKDWVFINYTFKRFEGLTQRGGKLPRKS